MKHFDIKVLILVPVIFFLGSIPAKGMPVFTRKYDVECSTCHTIVPKLNRTGYEFRMAGWRLPEDIGKSEPKFDLANFFAARLMASAVLKHQSVPQGDSYTRTDIQFKEFTMYPLTGSWGKYFGSLMELSTAPDDVFEVENAYVRAVYGDGKGWFEARFGIFHPWEGFGASDRPIGLSRPLIQTSKAVGSPYTLWGLDQMGLEIGYYYAKMGTTIQVDMMNGIIWKEDGSGKAEPAQGGALTKERGLPGWNSKDFQIFFNQFITQESSISIHYYHGIVPYPDPNVFDTVMKDTFQRVTFYGNYWVVSEHLNLLAGYGFGHDSLEDPTILDVNNVGDSDGFFIEADVHASDNFALGARYDFFDPSDKVDNNNQNAFGAFANLYLLDGLQFIMDYQHKEIEQPPLDQKKKTDTFEIRLIYIW